MNEHGSTDAWTDSAVVPRFAQPATFMRAACSDSLDGVEIALVGVPFDLGSTNRAGPRHGPAQIREMSRLVRGYHPGLGINPFELCRIADLGDTPTNPMDVTQSLELITEFFGKVHAAGALPLAAGGDHTITLPILRAIARDRPLAVVHFDAHSDVLDVIYGTKVNNGTPFRRAVEENLIDPKRTIQIGIRGSKFAADDWDYCEEVGMRVITIDEFFEMGLKAVIEEARRIVGGAPTYITFDVDGLDAVYVQGTGAPEIGGFSPRDAQVILRGLDGLDLVGADMCEVSPPLDPSGQTAVVASQLMFEQLSILAKAVHRRRSS